jgi:dUTP pyrophosphatase
MSETNDFVNTANNFVKATNNFTNSIVSSENKEHALDLIDELTNIIQNTTENGKNTDLNEHLEILKNISTCTINLSDQEIQTELNMIEYQIALYYKMTGTERPKNGVKFDELFLIEKMQPDAYLFKKANVNDAGYDISTYNDGIVPAWGSLLVNTNIKVNIPSGCYGRIASRSGLAVKHNIEVGAGVVDCDYHGEVKVLLRNLSDIPFEFKKGDRIAQFILTTLKQPRIPMLHVKNIDLQSERGTAGFGSTGL